jgi:hypothetical protein
VFSIATAAEDLSVSVETCRRRLADVSVTFGWTYDADSRVLYIPSWWTWNPPENQYVLAGNLKDLNEVPPCALTEAFACNLDTLDQSYHQTFAEGIAKRLRKGPGAQKQYQNLKQEKKQRTARGEAENEGVTSTIRPTDERLVSIAHEALSLIGASASIDEKIDTFYYFLSQQNYQPKPKRDDVISAIALAQSQRRTA